MNITLEDLPQKFCVQNLGHEFNFYACSAADDKILRPAVESIELANFFRRDEPYDYLRFKIWAVQSIQQNKSIIYFVFKDKKPIGLVGFDTAALHSDILNISYMVFSDQRRKGYASFMVSQALKQAFNHLDINRIYACTHNESSHKASHKVLNRNGFRYLGYQDSYQLFGGQSHQYYISRKDFEKN